ncbi:UNVERIFIED_CONTAM: hypothetical protein GTU68_038080 [Idotea baltica]|nr:hypothetical protein [Idotea baltica]
MDKHGEIDYTNLSALIEHHIASGTHGIVSVGTTGESATLTVNEHLSVIEFTIKEVAGRIPVIAGTGGNSTREAIHLTSKAYELKADATLLVVPYYNKPTQEGMYQHFKTIAEAVPIAQVLYNVPGRTVADMSNETVNRLADMENIVAIKDATGDMVRGRELINMCADRLAILSGDDPTALELMKLGAVGDISVTANVAPKEMSQLCEAALANNYQIADQIDQKLRALHDNLFVEANPIPVKYAVSKQGFTTNTLRLPLTPLSSNYESVLDEAMLALT